MFIYLSKKIAIPNNTRLCTISWENDSGWIACGGEDGLLKVLKLEQSASPNIGSSTTLEKEEKQPGSNLTMNQSLEGHGGQVVVSTWNYQHRKLTTSDSQGLIIVWIMYNGVWYEEMINNRNKSVVSCMHWSKDGGKICIVYEDGAVIVGSVDGNRIWGKDIKGAQLSHAQWSPDSKTILFGTSTGELLLHDSNGNLLTKIDSYCHDNAGALKISAMEWYNGLNGYVEAKVPCLALCFENGKVQIMKDEKDSNPIVVDTHMKFLKMKWNNNGSLLAVSGVQFVKTSQGEEKEICIVQFYDLYGQYQRFLKVPGKRISSISWESNGLRLAVAVDSFIYFANIRPDYKWTFFANDILVYTFNRADRVETIAIFWNTKTGEKYAKWFTKIYFIKSSGDYCVIVTKSDDNPDYFVLTVSNGIGTSIESKEIEFEPTNVCITRTHVFVSNTSILYDWQFRSEVAAQNGGFNSSKYSAIDALRKNQLKERGFHVDDTFTIGTLSEANKSILELKSKKVTEDQIISVAANDSALVILRASGQILQFQLPSFIFESKFQLLTTVKPHRCELNSTATKLLILDTNGLLRMVQLDLLSRKPNSNTGGIGGLVGSGTIVVDEDATLKPGLMDFERKDVWDMKWSEDFADSFAIMEKTRLYVFKNHKEQEDPIPGLGCICQFSELQVKIALIDDIMKDPDTPTKEAITIMESKPLRDARVALAAKGLPSLVKYVEANPHPRLWKLLAEVSLMDFLDLNVAKNCFVKLNDYQGLQLVKKLRKIDDAKKQKAEILAYYQNFEMAERLYLEMDRKDLAIDLRIRLGDWFRVVQLIKSSSAAIGGVVAFGGGSAGTDDKVLEKAWKCIGDYYYDRQRWKQASTYYAQGREYEKLSECYYLIEDFEGMETILSTLPENNPLLKKIAYYFACVGMCEQAVSAHVKLGDIKAAVDVCVHLNQWNTAIDLAKAHKFKEIENLLTKYANYLMGKNKIVDAIELYRKSNYCLKSANLLYNLAEKAIKDNKNPLDVKKLYVLAAFEVERYRSLNKVIGGAHKLNETGSKYINKDLNPGVLDNPWRGAEAYHFYLLAQRQYYEGNFEAAIKTALHLREFDDIIDAKTIYSLISLISLQNKQMGTCSKAFIKLESLPEGEKVKKEELELFETLAFEIFTKFPPVDPPPELEPCVNCGLETNNSLTYCNHCQENFPCCIASGKPIIQGTYFTCHGCKRSALESEINEYTYCPMCHTTL